ncbi:hypothetical protein HZH66_000238 [Vespula vulgaris]|uniref:Uncharacterized protein n=1 Tax=Vespula vulgaris TaxID=7454 RepID=A0A834KSQ9_VESVU|nr:hypothetical protein HZH66_000238 [Vespula vulgaris]
MSLTKRIDEVRLLESRKSARLADQDTDFARLADMAGDRKRASSHSIDVPHVIGFRLCGFLRGILPLPLSSSTSSPYSP